MSNGMLEAWRRASDEDWMRTMLSSLWGIGEPPDRG